MNQPLSLRQRNEVVTLILSLTSNLSTAPGDLAAIQSRLEYLESQQADVSTSLQALRTSLSSISSDLSDVVVAVGNVTADVTSISLTLNTLSSDVASTIHDVSDLSRRVDSNEVSISDLTRAVSSVTSDLANVTTTVNSLTLGYRDLLNRVVALEQSSPGLISVRPPLVLDNNVLSLSLDPDFCSSSTSLSSYSSNAEFGGGAWLVDAGNYGNTSAYLMNVIAHAHGSRTDFRLSSTTNFTSSGSEAYLRLSTSRITEWPISSRYRLLPSDAFRASSFPFSITYRIGDATASYTGSGLYTAQDTCEFRFVTGFTLTANIQVMSLTYSIDT